MRTKFVFCLLFICTQYSIGNAQTPYHKVENINYYQVETQTTYQKKRCVLDLYYPNHNSEFSTIIWLHGGGLTSGEKHIPEALKNKNVAIVAVNYRLHPKVNHPIYIRDAAAAVAWVFNHIEEYGGDVNSIYLSGHSAGGYLAAMVGLNKQYLQEHEVDANDLAGIIPFSGHMITHMTVRAEMGIDQKIPTIDKYAPLFHVRNDAPPLLLITGDRSLELLGRYEENAYMMRMMKVAGHKNTRILELDGYDHGMTEPAFPLLLNEIQRIERLEN